MTSDSFEVGDRVRVIVKHSLFYDEVGIVTFDRGSSVIIDISGNGDSLIFLNSELELA